jgi:hypothetical protein
LSGAAKAPRISLSSTVKANGRFVFANVLPGRYQLHLRGLPETLYLAGVRVGSRQFAPDAVEFMPDAANVSIIIKRK